MCGCVPGVSVTVCHTRHENLTTFVSSGHGGCQRTFEFLTREQGGKSDYNLQSDEINSVSVCITLLEYLPRTDTRVTLRLPTTVVSCQGEREKDTFTRVIGYLF